MQQILMEPITRVEEEESYLLSRAYDLSFKRLYQRIMHVISTNKGKLNIESYQNDDHILHFTITPDKNFGNDLHIFEETDNGIKLLCKFKYVIFYDKLLNQSSSYVKLYDGDMIEQIDINIDAYVDAINWNKYFEDGSHVKNTLLDIILKR